MVKDKTKLYDKLLNYALPIILGIMILGVIIIEPSFVSIKNFTNILSQASTRAILAMGVAGLIVLQGTDLSAGRILGLSAIVSASLLQDINYAARMYPNLEQLPLIVPFLIAIGIGVFFTLINGFGVAKLKLHAFIITLGTQLIAYGAALIYIDRPPLGAQPIAGLDERYTNLVKGAFKIGNIEIPYLIIYAAIIAVIMYFVWNKTKLGKNMFAIGGNPEAAAVSGVNLTKNIMYVYLIAGILYGIAGFLEAARIGSATSITGQNYELDAIAACVVGGVSFSGGVGTIPGVLIGSIILQFINYGLNFIQVNPYLQIIVKGLIIIVAVSIDVRKYIEKK
ncbi:galactose/methyl galactoside ABC transporter permease MglC [Paratissierella segnis]|jgi:methyl-galactoside transport system permease protein|uniref:Galactose/methyl galactoside ABC transporter permease MglC n=1 Tax=Paratissierella segnis TaxID=2763679 RepID=A0A926EVD1_9FIRM|nr:galactose/methyl galactoside ABC transporter permease MglC [Paratissierella segnis]MBC8588983.1 galactose/methyl galactoside ABC transporter permease MglC [Paratissierella segnis]